MPTEVSASTVEIPGRALTSAIADSEACPLIWPRLVSTLWTVNPWASTLILIASILPIASVVTVMIQARG